MKMKHEKATKIQKKYFNYINLKKTRKFFRAVRRLQTLFLCKIDYRKFKFTIKSIRKIQKYARKYSLKIKIKKNDEES